MSYKKERSMKLQDKVKRLLAANATLRETIKAKDEEIDSPQARRLRRPARPEAWLGWQAIANQP